MADRWSRGTDRPPPGVDARVAHIARVYDCWLGGKDNFAADRYAAEQARAAYPSIGQAVRAQRAFLGRAVRYLAAEAGIRQFLDIGTGIPAANNTHEVAQSITPRSRIVYVDSDPIVLSHARALLKSAPEGVTAIPNGPCFLTPGTRRAYAPPRRRSPSRRRSAVRSEGGGSRRPTPAVPDAPGRDRPDPVRMPGQRPASVDDIGRAAVQRHEIAFRRLEVNLRVVIENEPHEFGQVSTPYVLEHMDLTT